MKTKIEETKANIWSKFAERAVPLKPVEAQKCACPPSDWTVNVKDHPT